MIYLINGAIIALAIFFAFKVASNARKYFVSIGIILMGIALHALDAYLTYKSGQCEINQHQPLVYALDACINYESKMIVYSQAFIIAGFIVIFLGFALSKIDKD